MRTRAIKICVRNLTPAFKDYLDSHGFDYEYSSKEGCYIIYLHFDDAFPYHVGILNYHELISSVINLFPNRKGKYRDIIELYYQVEKKDIDPDVDWFEWMGSYWQNVRFPQLLLHQNKTLFTRKEIYQIYSQNGKPS